MKAEKTGAGRSPGKASKHLQRQANIQQSHGLGVQNSASDGHSQLNDINTVNDSMTSAQKLRRGRKPLQSSGVKNASVANISTDSMTMPQEPDESNNTTSDTSPSLKEKGTKKRKADKRTAAKGSSQENSEEPNSANFEKVFRKYVASSKKRKLEDQFIESDDETAGNKHHKLEKKKTEDGENVEDRVSSAQQLKYWKRLRQDLERVRLLMELIRKREKMKSTLVSFSVAF